MTGKINEDFAEETVRQFFFIYYIINVSLAICRANSLWH